MGGHVTDGEGRPTLITVDSVSAALTRFTSRPIETFVTLTHSCPVGPIQTHSVTKAGLIFGPWTWLAVFPKEPSTAPRHLSTQHTLPLFSFLWVLGEQATYNIFLEAGGSAADRQQLLSFKYPTEHASPLLD